MIPRFPTLLSLAVTGDTIVTRSAPHQHTCHFAIAVLSDEIVAHCLQAILCARCPAFEQAIQDSTRFEDITLARGHGSVPL
jgi:hypothetical protein